MKLVVKSPQAELKESTQDYIERRTAFAFSRLRPFVNTLQVVVQELDISIGGKDKECKVRIQREGESEIIMVERQVSMRLAIDRALFRASYHLQRRVKRQQEMRLKKRVYQMSSSAQIIETNPGGDAA